MFLGGLFNIFFLFIILYGVVIIGAIVGLIMVVFTLVKMSKKGKNKR